MLVEVLQRWFPQVPAVLVMVVLATAATSVLPVLRKVRERVSQGTPNEALKAKVRAELDAGGTP